MNVARRLLYRNFRTVYRASRWLERRLTPAGQTLAGGLVASGVFAIDTRQTLAFQIATLLAALFLVAIAASLRYRPRLRLQRRLPALVTAGVPCGYTLRIVNDASHRERDLVVCEQLASPLPSFEEFTRARESASERRNWFDRVVGYPRWLDTIRTRRGADVPLLPLPELPPRGETEVRIELRPARRGYVRFGATAVLRPDPFGLVNASHRVVNPQTLLVLPRRYPVVAPRAAGRRRYQQGGEALASAVGDSQEFAQLRDYRPGDPLRNIHWRSWARTGKPVVKEFHDEYFDRNALVLDTFAPAGAAFEDAVSVAASFVTADWGPDSLLDLLFVAPEAVRYTAGRGVGATSGMLELLACVEPCPPAQFAALANLVLGHAGRISAAICVLQAWDRPRQALIGRLLAERRPVLALVVTEPGVALEPGPLAGAPHRLVAVPAGAAAAALARIDGRALSA